MHTLKRTQMYFPEGMLNELRKKAEKEKTSISDIVRNAVAQFLSKDKSVDWGNDSLWSVASSMESGDAKLSERHDDYLYK
jgi:ribosome recycling factor